MNRKGRQLCCLYPYLFIAAFDPFWSSGLPRKEKTPLVSATILFAYLLDHMPPSLRVLSKEFYDLRDSRNSR